MTDRKPDSLKNPSATCAAGPRSMRSGRSTRQDTGRQVSPSTAAASTRAQL